MSCISSPVYAIYNVKCVFVLLNHQLSTDAFIVKKGGHCLEPWGVDFTRKQWETLINQTWIYSPKATSKQILYMVGSKRLYTYLSKGLSFARHSTDSTKKNTPQPSCSADAQSSQERGVQFWPQTTIRPLPTAVKLDLHIYIYTSHINRSVEMQATATISTWCENTLTHDSTRTVNLNVNLLIFVCAAAALQHCYQVVITYKDPAIVAFPYFLDYGWRSCFAFFPNL